MRTISALAASFLLLLSAPAALAGKGQITYTGTLNVSKAFSERTWVNGLGMGLGTYQMVDYQPLPWMAIGLGFGISSYPAEGGSIKTDCLDVAGRLLPVSEREGQAILPYLVGGAGVRPLAKIEDDPLAVVDSWQGHYHAFAGMGMRYDLDRKPGGSGIDLQFVYEFYTPIQSNLNTVGVRLGYSIGFGGKKGPASAGAMPAATPEATAVLKPEAPKGGMVMVPSEKTGLTQAEKAQVKAVEQADSEAQAQAAAAQAAVQASGTYTVAEGDTLWRIACRASVYGDCELYPLVLLANTDVLKSPDDLKPGMVLKIDRNVSDEMKARARRSAWRDDYVRWRGSKVTRSRYDEWKKKRDQMAPSR